MNWKTLKRIQMLTVVLLTFTLAGMAQDESAPYRQQENLVYGDVHGIGLLMDVFTPTAKGNGLAIVDVASGAWYSDRGKIRDHAKAKIYDILCSHGYVVFAIRPGSRTKWTVEEMLDHVQMAIRYVKYHAKEYGIAPDQLGLMGWSAGGHLATLAAVCTVEGKPGENNPLKRYGSDVKAAGVFFPPTDFLHWGDGPPNYVRLGSLCFTGGVKGKTDEEIRAVATTISPRYQAHAGAPPFLFIHGAADRVVPLQQSEVMMAALKEVGVPAELIVKDGAGHGWETLPEEVAKLADWFDSQLGTPDAAASRAATSP